MESKGTCQFELFSLNIQQLGYVADTALYRTFGLGFGEIISPSQLQQIVYQLNMYERYPDVRPRYVDEQNLHMFKTALKLAIIKRYEQITELNYFDSSSFKFPNSNSTPAQMNIINFFDSLFKQIDGSEFLVNGIRTHFVTTNYDFVIETILDNTLEQDDSLFLYTYRGFTPTPVVKRPALVPVHDHGLTWHLLKINGGFEILQSGDNYELDYSRRQYDDISSCPPVLILPSREQNYADPYFRSIFPKAVRLLRETKVLILVGYSLPKEDVLIRFILRQFAEEPEDGRGKYIFYIGPDIDGKHREAIIQVFSTIKIGAIKPLNLYVFNGGFDEFAAECMQIG